MFLCFLTQSDTSIFHSEKLFWNLDESPYFHEKYYHYRSNSIKKLFNYITFNLSKKYGMNIGKISWSSLMELIHSKYENAFSWTFSVLLSLCYENQTHIGSLSYTLWAMCFLFVFNIIFMLFCSHIAECCLCRF